MPTRQTFFILLVASAIGFGIVAARREETCCAVADKDPVRPETTTLGTPAKRTTHVRAQREPAEVATDSERPLSEQVARLLATRDPDASYKAYYLVSDCGYFNRHHSADVYDDELKRYRPMNVREIDGKTKVCGALTEREWQARLDYLAVAVQARVPGAAWTFAGEGPLGDQNALKTRPGDPVVQEWKARANAQLAEAAEAGDIGTLMAWGHENLNGSDRTERNPVRGYAYLLAIGMIAADRTGPDDPTATIYADGSELMRAMAVDLTPQQRAAATDAARHIAENAKKSRRQAS